MFSCELKITLFFFFFLCNLNYFYLYFFITIIYLCFSFFSGQELAVFAEQNNPQAAVARQFLTMLAVCHTVIPDRDESDGGGGRIIYHAASPGMIIPRLD